MTIREMWIYSLIFFGTSLFTVYIAFGAITSKPLFSLPKIKQKQPSIVLSSQCTATPKIANLNGAQDPHLKKLSEYQEACQSLATKHLMIFTDMPKDQSQAVAKAQRMATQLKEFAVYGVEPIVIVEPVTEWGLIDYQEFKSGFYDAWIKTYFEELKKSELSDTQMGMWVPFPEANLPYWNHQNAKPEDFAAIVNKYLEHYKAQFPAGKASILLNSATYENDDFNWQSGEYVSLLPYVKDIKPGLLTSFGLQGLPWSPPATAAGPGVFDAAEYLNHLLAIEAADTLGVEDIWLNTGSFQKKYALDEEKTITVSPEKRKDVLNGILAESLKLKEKGYSVSINLFSEDKSMLEEATDWSYWQSGAILSSSHTPVFVNFVSRLYAEGIGLSLFDRQK